MTTPRVCPTPHPCPHAGYTLLGLEQTSESTQLPAFSFPEKCVLVLGREKEGMPPEVRSCLGPGQPVGGGLGWGS